MRYEDRVIQKTLRILDTHKPQPVSESIAQRLAAIFDRAEQELAGAQFTA